MRNLLLASTLLTAIGAGALPALAADCDITVGVVMELTGPAGEYGQAGAKSVEMAFRDFNDAGGVGGCKLVTDTRDSQSQGNVAVDQATQLVNIKKVPVIIGGNYYEMVFLTYYLWRQLAPPEGFAASKTFQIFADTLTQIEQDTPETCRALIFIPTKEQLYYPYVYPSERQWLRQNA